MIFLLQNVICRLNQSILNSNKLPYRINAKYTLGCKGSQKYRHVLKPFIAFSFEDKGCCFLVTRTTHH